MSYNYHYNDWEIEELTSSIREEIDRAKQPLPKKINKHFISIRHRIGLQSYNYPYNDRWLYMHPEFKTREEAENYINKICEKIGDNMWKDVYASSEDYYEDEEGNKIPFHYELNEYDAEVYEDGEYHTVYSEEEKKDLSEALYCIEKARVYMREYDRALSNGSIGNGGSFHKSLQEELEKFEKNYTEEYIVDEEN